MSAAGIATWYVRLNAAGLAAYGLAYLAIPAGVTHAVFGVGYPSVPFAVDARAVYAGTGLGLALYFAAALREGERSMRGALLCCALLYGCTAVARLTGLLVLRSDSVLLWTGCAGEFVAAASGFALWSVLRRMPLGHPAPP